MRIMVKQMVNSSIVVLRGHFEEWKDGYYEKRGLKKFAAGVTLLLALGLLAGCGGEKRKQEVKRS